MTNIKTDKYLKQLFELGTTYSDPIEVFPNIKVVFRILPPDEVIEVAERVAEFKGIESKAIVSQIQTLARAIYQINDMVLIMAAADVDKLKAQLGGQEVTQVEQAAYILANDFPLFVIDTLDQAYLKFYQEVLESAETLKKKLKKPSKQES